MMLTIMNKTDRTGTPASQKRVDNSSEVVQEKVKGVRNQGPFGFLNPWIKSGIEGSIKVGNVGTKAMLAGINWLSSLIFGGNGGIGSNNHKKLQEANTPPSPREIQTARDMADKSKLRTPTTEELHGIGKGVPTFSSEIFSAKAALDNASGTEAPKKDEKDEREMGAR